jgi:hypothetical protein
MASLIQPLSSQVPIVDDEGKPLPSFITMLQKLGVGTGLDGSSGSIALAAMAAKTILANKTVGSAAPTACTLSDILDFASSTRGSILYRGNTGWAALAPGTAGQFLKTNGAGADPAWAAGGGSSTPWYWSPPAAASFTLSNGAGAGNMVLTDDTDCGLIIEPSTMGGSLSHAFALQTLAGGASSNWTMTARFEGSCNGEFEYNGFGLCLYESSTNKFIDFYYQRTYGQSASIAVCNWAAPGTFSSDQRILHSTKHPWLRVVHAGGNNTFQISACGKRWITIITLGDTAFLAGKADKVGLTMGCSTSANLYWQYTCQNYSVV